MNTTTESSWSKKHASDVDIVDESLVRDVDVDVTDPEAGLTTAELLGNAALGIAALVLIWAGLQALGLDIVDWIRAQVLQ